MSETEIEDAPPWPHRVGDGNHPFGEIAVSAMLCAHCAAANLNSSWPLRVEETGAPHRRTDLFAGAQLALLAAASHPDRFRVVSFNGQWLNPRAVTAIGGTLLCEYHLHDGYGKLRRP